MTQNQNIKEINSIIQQELNQADIDIKEAKYEISRVVED